MERNVSRGEHRVKHVDGVNAAQTWDLFQRAAPPRHTPSVERDVAPTRTFSSRDSSVPLNDFLFAVSSAPVLLTQQRLQLV
ncbi:hypothetical protein EYF80_047939 [Liparis tanakae]|uniref:Uncharacterized protein n=1 Tax=Liparis tanakae TaxID=230148 RepID=A0A4Z2FLX0_9TELE|nr:hypothetical protein EYF80_047939 [Liparis tanakae]